MKFVGFGLRLMRRTFHARLSATVTAALFATLSPSGPALAAPPSAANSRRPNILLIVADDMGYGELGCQGWKDIPTPHIDSIARHGIRFTNGYVSCPVCSPTRAGLMTGRYQQRFGHEFNPGRGEMESAHFGLVRDETTLAERLKAAGYATGLVGKWHLGSREGLRPTERGFDEFFGFLGGLHVYIPNGRSRGEIVRGTEHVEEPEYLTDAFRREALAFIDRHGIDRHRIDRDSVERDGERHGIDRNRIDGDRAQPFFLYLAFNAVHGPLQATARYRDRFPQIADPRRRTFAGMLSAMDDAVGAVLGKLHDAGLEESTLVFFLSDNGGPTPLNTSRNDPLRGGKGTTWEGGIRIPFLIQWTGHLPAGIVDDRPVISLDIHATALAAAGVPTPTQKKLDGVNLLPFLTPHNLTPHKLTQHNTATPHEFLFWRFGEQMAVRKGDWKITRAISRPGQALPRRNLQSIDGPLYNLRQDIGEKTDVAAKHPEVVKELADAWEKWNAELMPPRWSPPEAAAPPAAKNTP
jgi:arylsulfatase A-like enzyme